MSSTWIQCKKQCIARGGLSFMRNISIEERAVCLAQYIIDSKDTVRGAAKKFGISKSTVHTEVTLKNGRKFGQIIHESIEIKKVFLAEKNPVVKLGLVIKWNHLDIKKSKWFFLCKIDEQWHKCLSN